jgi:hypothetical protein
MELWERTLKSFIQNEAQRSGASGDVVTPAIPLKFEGGPRSDAGSPVNGLNPESAQRAMQSFGTVDFNFSPEEGQKMRELATRDGMSPLLIQQTIDAASQGDVDALRMIYTYRDKVRGGQFFLHNI